MNFTSHVRAVEELEGREGHREAVMLVHKRLSMGNITMKEW